MSKTPLAIEDYPGYSANEWRGRFASETIEWMEPDQLLAHPDNHRIHIQLQQQQVETLLDVLGWVDVVKVNKRTGCTVDGHLRVILAIRHKTKVPVLWLDLSETEERAALTSLDYTASKAGIDLNILATNVEFMQVEFPALEVVWDNVGIEFGMNGDDWNNAFDKLPDSDRAPFQQITFTLHDTQAETIKRALSAAKAMGDFSETENENSNGNALARICELFIGDHA